VRGVREIHRVFLSDACGIWYGHQACNEWIWNSVILNGVRRNIESVGFVMGARNQEECDLNLSD
jgi:hypothetical protein